MSQKGDTLSVIAKIVEQWLMVNCNLDVEKVLDLKEFIESLDAPTSFKLKDGTLIHINRDNGHDVEVKHPVFDYKSSHPMDIIINEQQRDLDLLNPLDLEGLKFEPLDTTEAPKKLSLFELAKEVYKSTVGKYV